MLVPSNGAVLAVARPNVTLFFITCGVAADFFPGLACRRTNQTCRTGKSLSKR